MTYFDLIKFGEKRSNKTLQAMSMSAAQLKVTSDDLSFLAIAFETKKVRTF